MIKLRLTTHALCCFREQVVSPPHLADLFTEKFIYLPNHFFSKGHAVQAEVKKPTYDYLPAQKPYKIGTGSPQENACLTDSSKKPKFVFCNFNKFLKNSPDTVRSWIRILREVPDSTICLLENPKSGIHYLRRFVHEVSLTVQFQYYVHNLADLTASFRRFSIPRPQEHPFYKMTVVEKIKFQASNRRMAMS